MASKPQGEGSTQATNAPNSETKFQKKPGEDYGYYFYPDRDSREPKRTFWQGLWEGRGAGHKLTCETNVAWCVDNRKFQ